MPKLNDDAAAAADALLQVTAAVADSHINENIDDEELCEPAAKRDKNAKKDRCHYCCKVTFLLSLITEHKCGTFRFLQIDRI